jgi:hypothetical protein
MMRRGTIPDPFMTWMAASARPSGRAQTSSTLLPVVWVSNSS